MATTTNYGWTTPDDTALVKDGAAAIRSLGTSVDTTTKALNPSTTLGDIEYRSSTANTNTRLGIGSSGQVLTVDAGVPSWANGFSNPLTTTGDTIYSSSGSTPARLGIGSTGQVLTVSGGIPSWATPSAGGGATLLSTTTLSSTTTTISSISGSYKDLLLIIRRATTSSSAKIQIKPNATNQSTFSCKTAGSATWTTLDGNIDPGVGLNNDTLNANFNLAMHFYNYADASNPTPFDFSGFFSDTNGNLQGIIGGGGFRTNAAISSIEILATAGNLSGTALLYGVN